MRWRGLEPPRACAHKALNLARLPIPPPARGAIVPGRETCRYASSRYRTTVFTKKSTATIAVRRVRLRSTIWVPPCEKTGPSRLDRTSATLNFMGTPDDARATIQRLLVTGDNRLKQGVAIEKVRESYLAALDAARAAGLEEAVRPLVELRLADLEKLAAEAPPPFPPAA